MTGFTTIGTGLANTNIIVAAYGNAGNIAAACKNYNGGSYTDWFLPSYDELREIYKTRDSIKTIKSETYWSSSAYGDSDNPYEDAVIDFRTGTGWVFTVSSAGGIWNSTLNWWDPVPTANIRAVRCF